MAQSYYNPSAPPMPNSTPPSQYNNNNNNYHQPPPQPQGSFHGGGYGPSPSFSSSPSFGYGGSGFGYGDGYGGYGQQQQQQYPGVETDVVRAFQMVDRDRSGFVDDRELQEALCLRYQRFHLRTIRLLMFLFANRREGSSLRLGFDGFVALWRCLAEWRAVFERFDRDRSGRIDTTELKDALYSLGYAVPPSVMKLLTSLYEADGTSGGQRAELTFDKFVECGVVIKGLTDEFKEKDRRYTGSATIQYDTFMSMVLPYIVTYE